LANPCDPAIQVITKPSIRLIEKAIARGLDEGAKLILDGRGVKVPGNEGEPGGTADLPTELSNDPTPPRIWFPTLASESRCL